MFTAALFKIAKTWKQPNSRNVHGQMNGLYGTTKDPELPKQFCRTKTKQEAQLSQTSGNTTKPQSSRQCGTGTKTDIQTNGTE